MVCWQKQGSANFGDYPILICYYRFMAKREFALGGSMLVKVDGTTVVNVLVHYGSGRYPKSPAMVVEELKKNCCAGCRSRRDDLKVINLVGEGQDRRVAVECHPNFKSPCELVCRATWPLGESPVEKGGIHGGRGD